MSFVSLNFGGFCNFCTKTAQIFNSNFIIPAARATGRSQESLGQRTFQRQTFAVVEEVDQQRIDTTGCGGDKEIYQYIQLSLHVCKWQTDLVEFICLLNTFRNITHIRLFHSGHPGVSRQLSLWVVPGYGTSCTPVHHHLGPTVGLYVRPQSVSSLRVSSSVRTTME